MSVGNELREQQVGRDRRALLADHRNYYRVEQWSRDGMRVERMLFAGYSLDRARTIFQAELRRRPHGRYTIRQRTRVLDQWPQ